MLYLCIEVDSKTAWYQRNLKHSMHTMALFLEFCACAALFECMNETVIGNLNTVIVHVCKPQTAWITHMQGSENESGLLCI